jgi:hypothetical protein
VHPLTLIYQLVLLLFDDLAENFLIELHSRIQSEEANAWNKSSVLSLMSAAGKGMISSDASIDNILQYLTVGTDLTKCSPDDVVYQQPVTAAKLKLKHDNPLGEKYSQFEFSDKM